MWSWLFVHASACVYGLLHLQCMHAWNCSVICADYYTVYVPGVKNSAHTTNRCMLFSKRNNGISKLVSFSAFSLCVRMKWIQAATNVLISLCLDAFGKQKIIS